MIEPDVAGWRIDGQHFDAVVLASPAGASAELLTSVAPEAAAELGRFEHADVIMVRLAVASDGLPRDFGLGHSGYLVAKSRQRHVTAVSFGSRKWAHWRLPDGGQVLRVSLGRDGLPVDHLGDDDVTAAVLSELGQHLGVDLQPRAVSITRWKGAFPQYRPHHAERVAAVERVLPAGIVLAGAGYRGIGIPACIADGGRAAAAVAGVKRSPAPADGSLT